MGNDIDYNDVSFILGLKVKPGKENNVRSAVKDTPNILKSFKALGQFDVILLIGNEEDAPGLMKKMGEIENVLNVFFIDLE